MGVRLRTTAARFAVGTRGAVKTAATHSARWGRSAIHFLTTEAVLVTLAFLGGVALIAAGTALIYLPAGLIASGLFLIAGAVLWVRHDPRRA